MRPTIILLFVKVNFFYISIKRELTLQQTYSPDITTASSTLYNRTSWTIQHALSSDHLPIMTTINIRHEYRLQQNDEHL